MYFITADGSGMIENRIKLIKNASTSDFVKPLEIEQKCFQRQRKDKIQEGLRQLILESFSELNRRPEVFGRPFTIISPPKTWDGGKKVCKLQELSNSIGDHMASWVEIALFWANEINRNKKNWKKLSNRPDQSEWYRLIIWKDSCARLIGGSKNTNHMYSASAIFELSYGGNEIIYDTVPAVVKYEN